MVEGLKEALQYITGLKAKSMEPKLVEIEGRTYCTDNDLTRYHRFPMASDIEVNTLTALVDYIKGKPEELRGIFCYPCGKSDKGSVIFRAD